jgi:hypothetical protein
LKTFNAPRRALLLAAPLLLPRPAWAVPPSQAFRLLREGRDIGIHAVTVTETADGYVARNEVDVLVRLMGITVFRMKHVYEERWSGERLVAFTSREDRSGSVKAISARQQDGALVVTGTSTARLPAEAAPLGWWDPRRLGTRPLFDADEGGALTLRWQRQALAGGEVVLTASGDVTGEGRYAADNSWLAFRQTVEDGSTVEYRRVG